MIFRVETDRSTYKHKRKLGQTKKRPEPLRLRANFSSSPWFHLNSYLADTHSCPVTAGTGGALPPRSFRMPSLPFRKGLHQPPSLFTGLFTLYAFLPCGRYSFLSWPFAYSDMALTLACFFQVVKGEHLQSLLRNVLLEYNFGGFHKSILKWQESSAIIGSTNRYLWRNAYGAF